MLSIPELGAAIDEHAAIRRIRRMQPAGGVGDKLFPPTYPPKREGPPRHVFERRRLDDREVWCVLIDSVQSQANRMEEALLAAAAEEAIPLPYVTVDFREAGLQPPEQITSLDAPHRVYDAIIRDSLLDDVPFMESEQGLRRRRRRQPRCWKSRHRRYCSGLGIARAKAAGWEPSSRVRWCRRSWVWIRRSVGLLYTSTLRSTPSGSMRRQGSSGQGS